MPSERVARPTITIASASIQREFPSARALVAFTLAMSRRLLVARWTAAEASRIVTTTIARARFAMVLIRIAIAFEARRIRLTLVVARVEIARIEVQSRTTLPM